VKGYDDWLDNYGNPGIWPSEDDVINWNEANAYTDEGEPDDPQDKEYEE
jgi:hypothetical protein